MASTVRRICSGTRNSIQDELVKSGSYNKGDVIEVVTDAINLASVADAESVGSNVTDATGVAIGDVVLGVAPMAAAGDAVYSAGFLITAVVYDTDKVRLQFQNDSGGAVDPGSQTYRILIMKAA